MFISGIASGLDTEQIVEQLLAVERRPLVLMRERKDVLQQQRDAWRDINSRLNNLRERMADLSRASLYDRRAATSSAEDVATVSATNAAAEGRYTIIVNDAADLAAAHRVASERVEDADGQSVMPTEPLGIAGTSLIGVAD